MTEPATAPRRARVMTYNVHSFIGTDGVYDPERVACVIERSDVDLVALQEVESRRSSVVATPVCEWLASRLGMQCHFTFTRTSSHGEFGNAVLSRHAFDVVSEGSLPRRSDEARAVQWLKVIAPHWEFHLMNTHLSVSLRERRGQVRALLGAEWLVRAGTELPLVVCGDFNATPYSSLYRRLRRELVDVQAGNKLRVRATWPSRLPFWRIDHLFVSRDLRVISARVIRDEITRRASDHLPLLAELEYTKLGGSDAADA